MPPGGRLARLTQNGPSKRAARHPKPTPGRRRHAQEDLKTRADLFASLSPQSFAAASLLALFEGAQILDQTRHRLRQLAVEFVRTLKPSPALRQAGSDNARVLDRWLLSQFVPWATTRTSSGKGSANERQIDELGSSLDQLARLADMQRPQDSWPAARMHRRRIHLHVGPTNSGKTHAALRALHAAHNGAYAGPLRLLAHEVFRRFNDGQVAADLPPRRCNLVTGEERRIVDGAAGLVSCTVEMLSKEALYDVCVIDEIQMLGEADRGDAWTEAVLGTRALELHLCGEESVVDLIRRIGSLCGDEVLVHRYQRLSPLRVAPHSLRGDLSRVRKGDCIVAFSRSGIYALKREIERKSPALRVGVAYGGLPPEVRERQAQLFNIAVDDPASDGYDVLVGSDALGMGLNLKIKRVVFESLRKFDGRLDVPLASSQIKQIGGRAGRYYAVPQSSSPGSRATEGVLPAGEVLTVEERDMDELRDKMDAPVAPMTRAMLRAPPESLEAIARLMPPGTPLAHLFGLRQALTVASPLFRICDERNPIKVAEVLEPVAGLSLRHRLVFASAPANARDPLVLDALRRWAVQHAHGREADFSAWWAGSRWGDLLREESGRTNEDDIRQLESAHRCLTLYLWLAARLPQTFTAHGRCQETKGEVERSLMSQISHLAPIA